MIERWKQSEKELVVKSAAEWAAEAGSDPWKCPQCGCLDWRIVDSRYVTDDPRFSGYAKRRIRICRHCKSILPSGHGTLEVAIPDGHKIVVLPSES